jgi:hypothetical protein
MPVYQGGKKLSRGRSGIRRLSTPADQNTKYNAKGGKIRKTIDFLEKGDKKFIEDGKGAKCFAWKWKSNSLPIFGNTCPRGAKTIPVCWRLKTGQLSIRCWKD